jgi:hypothetical protein
VKQIKRIASKLLPSLFIKRPKMLFDNRHLLGRQIAKMLSGVNTIQVVITESNELTDWRISKYPEGFYWRASSVASVRRNFFIYVLNHSDRKPRTVAAEYNDDGVSAVYDIFYQRAHRQTDSFVSAGYTIELKEIPSLTNEQWGEFLDGALIYEMARLHTVL